jgi:hypothetical protein
MISSGLTAFYKFVFPPIWLVGPGGLVVAALTASANAAPPGAIRWAILVWWLVGGAVIGWVCVRLKEVRMDDHALYVSNYFTETSVPITAIAAVGAWWTNPEIVIVHLRAKTVFGDKIMFLAPWRPLGFTTRHPITAELRGLAGIQE